VPTLPRASRSATFSCSAPISGLIANEQSSSSCASLALSKQRTASKQSATPPELVALPVFTGSGI